MLRYLCWLSIRFYRLCLSPFLPAACIYHPSCSAYAQKAVEQYGFFRGGCLAFFRVLRCVGVLYRGGEDPVPLAFSWKHLFQAYARFWRFGGRT